MLPGVADIPAIIEINDPVSGYQIVLDQANQVAHRSVLPRRLGAPGTVAGMIPNGLISGAGPQATMNQRPEVSSESLGTNTIQGVFVEGRLTKITYPTGMFGNDRPIVSTSESWYSPELKLMVLTKSSDPRSGEMTRTLSDLNRAEPDPALFQIPPGYQVVDETGIFTIKVTRP